MRQCGSHGRPTVVPSFREALLPSWRFLSSGVHRRQRVVAAQQLPSEPPRQFGASITGAFEGWFDDADGTANFLVGYLNRNMAQAMDVPDRPEQSDRARRPRHGAADALPAGPQDRHVHRHGAQGLHAAAAADVDDRRQRPVRQSFRSACTPTTTSARSATSRSGTRRRSCGSRSRGRPLRDRWPRSTRRIDAHDRRSARRSR